MLSNNLINLFFLPPPCLHASDLTLEPADREFQFDPRVIVTLTADWPVHLTIRQ